ncbi:MAG TPA: tetratricopeptide repeat protein [Chthoniobacterales bacterium]|nr:tetratricopeptide repeat protein [Chthoniobacterales bacterium]
MIATLIAYRPAWYGTPIWDDTAHLTAEPLRTWIGLWRIWTEPGATQQYYPLVHSVFWVQQHLWGDTFLGYHLTNILLHAGAGIVLLFILRELEIPGARLAAIIFSLHPIEVESVAWMTELKNTLSGLLYLGSALAYLRYDANRRRSLYGLALGLFLLGLMAKSVIASLPAALLLVIWWKRGRIDWRMDVRPLVPFFLTGAAAGLFTAWMEHHFIGANGPAFALSPLDRILIAGRVIWFYLATLAWPANLIFIYPRWSIDSSAWWQYLYPLAALSMTVGCWLIRHRARWPLAAWLYFVGTLFPALGFINVYPFLYSFVADHFQYLAGIAPIAVAAAGISIFLERWPAAARLAVCSLAVLGLGALTWRQSEAYTDVRTSWETTIARNPKAWLAFNNLGTFLFYQGDTEAAIRHYDRALSLHPNYAEAAYNRANAYARKGDTPEAIRSYEQALRLQPDYPEAALNLGAALARSGRLDEATLYFQRAAELKPTYAEAHYNLGKALARQGKRAESIAHYEIAAKLAPQNGAIHSEVAAIYFEDGKIEAALDHYRRAVAIAPDNISDLNDLAWILATAATSTPGNRQAAIATAATANTLANGSDPVILQTLAVAHANAGHFSEAIETVDRALKLPVDNPPLDQSLQGLRNLFDAGKPYRDPRAGTP